MNDTLQKILSIDKEAERFRRMKVEALKKKKEELQSELKAVEVDNQEKLELEKKILSEKLFYNAELEMERIRYEGNLSVSRLKTSFENARTHLVDAAFNKLMEYFEEV